MKRSFLVVGFLIICSLFVAGPASATTLTLDYLIGTVVPASPASPSDELVYANNLITWYNGGANPNGGAYVYTLGPDASQVPGVPGSGSLADATGAGVSYIAPISWPLDVTGFTYLWAKFGDQGALYYLDSLTSVDGFDPAWGPFSQQGGGLSHVTLFGPGTTVPEAGALLMFGSGLIGLVAYRRIRRMQ